MGKLVCGSRKPVLVMRQAYRKEHKPEFLSGRFRFGDLRRVSECLPLWIELVTNR